MTVESKWDCGMFVNRWANNTLHRKTTHSGYLVKFFDTCHVLTYKPQSKTFSNVEVVSINLGEDVFLWNFNASERYPDFTPHWQFKFPSIFMGLDNTKAGLVDKHVIEYQGEALNYIALFTMDNEYFLMDHIPHDMTANEYRNFGYNGVMPASGGRSNKWVIKLGKPAKTIQEARESIIPEGSKERPDDGFSFCGYWFVPDNDVPPPPSNELVTRLINPPHPLSFEIPDEFWTNNSEKGRWELIRSTRDGNRTILSGIKYNSDLIKSFDVFWDAVEEHEAYEKQYTDKFTIEAINFNYMTTSHKLRTEGKTLAEVRADGKNVWIKGVLHRDTSSLRKASYETEKAEVIVKRINSWHRLTGGTMSEKFYRQYTLLA